MAKLLLCHPLFLNQQKDSNEASSPYFPLGLLYLAAYVRDRGHEVAIFDGTFANSEVDFKQQLDSEVPDLVGISALLPNRGSALKLAQIAHTAGYPVVLGGPDPTYSPEFYLEHSQVDLVVHHEGEETIQNLLNHCDSDTFSLSYLQNEPGLAYRLEGKIKVTAPREPIEDLDSLPTPARDLIDMDAYLDYWKQENGYSSLTIATSRGCPYGCEWCQYSVHGQEFRQRSPESVAREVQQLSQKYEIDRLRLVDDVDGLDASWIEDWAGSAESLEAVIPFEGLNELKRQDIPMLDVRDSL
ncbi:MAG: radical SAM protein [Anaerolineae bacterium]|nr:radical SAM protein [Anaerolineae bacterium]